MFFIGMGHTINMDQKLPFSNINTVVERKPRYWGFWATIGFSTLIVVANIGMSILAFVIYSATKLAEDPDADIKALGSDLESNGWFLSISTIPSAIVCVGLMFLFVKIRKGSSIRSYFHLTPVPPRVYLDWVGILLLLEMGGFFLFILLDRPSIPPFMEKVYQSAGSLPLLWVTITIAAPVVEEFFFRGFLFEGLRHSRLGSLGAIIITTVTWTVIHTQYEIPELAVVACLGVVLGIAKVKTGSLYVPLALHCLVNTLAMIAVTFYMQ